MRPFTAISSLLSGKIVVSFFPSRLHKVAMAGLLLMTLSIHLLYRRDPFASDESIYAYASYAINQGDTPYRAIQLAHPPLAYLVLGCLIAIGAPTASWIHLWKSLLIASTMLLVYAASRRLVTSPANSIVPLVSSAIYSYFTLVYFYTTFLEIFLTFLLVLCTTLYISTILNDVKHARIRLLFVGALMGAMFVTKYSSYMFSIVLLLHNVIRLSWSKRFRRVALDTAFMLAGFVIPVIVTVGSVVFHWLALRQFYLQTIYWQLIRWTMTMEQRIANISHYLLKFGPFLVMALLGSFLVIARREKIESPNSFLIMVLFSNAACILFLYGNFFLHYLYYLSPFLAILSAFGLAEIWKLLRSRSSSKNLGMFLLALIIGASCSLQLGGQFALFQDFPDEEIHRNIGQYVSELTYPTDRIWTSEGAIALSARRLIAPADSIDWPLHCSFSDVLAHDYDTYVGYKMKDFRNGVVSPNDFVQSWESFKVKVVVIIRGGGWIPYPDNVLWSGYYGRTGVSEYVQQNYVLAKTLISPNGSRSYEIWVRQAINATASYGQLHSRRIE